MKVEVLGTGCAKCKKLYEVMSQAVRESAVSAQVGKVEDIMAIMEYKVLALPAVAVDGRVVLAGRIPTLEEAKGLVKGAGDGR